MMSKQGSGLLILLSACIVTGQDTLLHETHNSYKPVKYGAVADFNKLEEHVDHRVRESERRVLRRMHERLHLQNQSQSTATHELQRTVERLTGHLEDLQQQLTSKDGVIDDLRQQLTHQQHEIHKNKNSLDRLHKMVTNLSELVEQLLSERTVSDVTSTTTPAPFTPMFPVGKVTNFHLLPSTRLLFVILHLPIQLPVICVSLRR